MFLVVRSELSVAWVLHAPQLKSWVEHLHHEVCTNNHWNFAWYNISSNYGTYRHLGLLLACLLANLVVFSWLTLSCTDEVSITETVNCMSTSFNIDLHTHYFQYWLFTLYQSKASWLRRLVLIILSGVFV